MSSTSIYGEKHGDVIELIEYLTNGKIDEESTSFVVIHRNQTRHVFDKTIQ